MVSMKGAFLLSLALLLAACTPANDPFANDALQHPYDVRQYQRDVEQWRTQRLARLRGPQGWLSYVGSGRLEAGTTYSVGSAPDSDVRLPLGPERVGRLSIDAAGKATIEGYPGTGVTLNGQPLRGATLQPAGDGKEASRLHFGSAEFYLVRIGNVLGWRCRDTNAALRRGFRGIEHFPVDPRWRVVARWKPFPRPAPAMLLSSIGTPLPAVAPGEAEFEVGGRHYRLQAMQDASEPLSPNLFFIFTDLTGGRETFGGARYLNASAPRDGEVVLDFNRAQNPPCALSRHVVCPIAPAVNRLELRVTAGEKYQFVAE